MSARHAPPDERRAPVRGPAVVIVPVHDGERWIGRCLDALFSSGDDELEVVAVDDASRDGSLALLRSRAVREPGLHVLANERSRGFAGAVNGAAAWALVERPSVELLAFVNQDCFAEPGWLAAFRQALADPSIAIAGARLLEADGVTLQHAGACVSTSALTSHIGRGSTDPSAFGVACDVDYVCGALFALSRRTWLELGPLDEGYAPSYYEEVDLCRRARRSGRRVVYVPECRAVHVEASTSGAGSRTFLDHYHRSRLRFVVHAHLGDVGAWRWLRAEAGWLLGLRRWHEIAPVLRAYAEVPRFVGERIASCFAAPDATPDASSARARRAAAQRRAPNSPERRGATVTRAQQAEAPR